MKLTMISILLALGAIGCQTSNDNAGAPPPGYESDIGQRQNSTSDTENQVFTPDESWQRYRYEGITPTTPP